VLQRRATLEADILLPVGDAWDLDATYASFDSPRAQVPVVRALPGVGIVRQADAVPTSG